MAQWSTQPARSAIRRRGPAWFATMLDWLSASPAERRLLPGGRLQGPTPYVIAIMMFVMVVIAAAGLALANAAGAVAQGVENRFSVQIADGAAKSPLAVRALDGAPGVAAVRPVPEQEMRKTLERWLGPAGGPAGRAPPPPPGRPPNRRCARRLGAGGDGGARRRTCHCRR